MALNNSTDMPPIGDGPYRIYNGWCLGDSLVFINANSTNFDNRIIANSTALAAASATLTTQTANTSSTIITTLSTVPIARLNDGNQSGVAPLYGCRAWVNFNGTGTIGAYQTIRAQGNVSSVYKNTNGDYTIYFTIPMPTTDYCVFGSGIEDAGASASRTSAVSLYSVATMSTNSVRVQNANIGATTITDGAVITVSIIC
jgi:hypothetical protein